MSTETNLETLDTLLRRYCGVEEPPQIPRVKFEEALRLRDDPLHVLPYLASLGIEVRTAEDLFLLNDDEDEEELYCFRVAEGVVAVMASDDLWLLFEISQP